MSVSKYFGVGWVRVPILFGNDLPMNDWPYSKGFMKFGCLEPSKSMFDFWIFLLIERRLSKFVRAPLMKFQYFWQTIFFRRNEKISWGKKHTALLKYHNWEKSSFFSMLLRAFVRLLELITFEILAAERLRLMGFDNRLIIDCFTN